MATDQAEALRLFLDGGAQRIARIAGAGAGGDLDDVFRPAAHSVSRQAAGNWTVATREEDGFMLSSAYRELSFGVSFGKQCARVIEMLEASKVPDLRDALTRLADPPAAIMAAFFAYFAVHELLHVEQGLGSDQYRDSELYMPIVMEADHVADVAGLAIVLAADIPELGPLDKRQRALVLIAIHIASMHSFADEGSLDGYAFARLLTWYVHFARFNKADVPANLATVDMTRPWVITLPRLIGRSDLTIDAVHVARRSDDPYPATCDVVLAYHHEDGLYRIHRAALTDPQRIARLCKAIVGADFDGGRAELEELLVNNPALVPIAAGTRAPNVEWAAGTVIERLESLRPLIGSEKPAATDMMELVLDDFLRLTMASRVAFPDQAAVRSLITSAAETLESLRDAITEGTEASARRALALRRNALIVVDEIAMAAEGA